MMDPTALQTVLGIIVALGVLVSAIGSVLGTVLQLRNGAKLGQVHDLVNGQSTKLETLTRASGQAEGREALLAEQTATSAGHAAAIAEVRAEEKSP